MTLLLCGCPKLWGPCPGGVLNRLSLTDGEMVMGDDTGSDVNWGDVEKLNLEKCTEVRGSIFLSGHVRGLQKFSNIVLKWGLSDDQELYDWRKQAMDGKVVRKNGSIVLLDDAGDEKVRWNFVNGWPTKWTGPSFNATASEVAVETLEIVHEGLTKA